MFENMNGENLKTLIGDDAIDFLVDMATQVGKLLPNLDTYKYITSWCNLGLYDVDFGWGKPIFVAPFIDTISSLNKQQTILVENGKNDGIEAWILRDNEEMVELEKDEEFLAFASPNPRVCVGYAPRTLRFALGPRRKPSGDCTLAKALWRSRDQRLYLLRQTWAGGLAAESRADPYSPWAKGSLGSSWFEITIAARAPARVVIDRDLGMNQKSNQPTSQCQTQFYRVPVVLSGIPDTISFRLSASKQSPSLAGLRRSPFLLSRHLVMLSMVLKMAPSGADSLHTWLRQGPILFIPGPRWSDWPNPCRLKNCLSETLTLFHPLAGELSSEDSAFVDCNDKGVLYVEARVKGVSLDEFLRNLDLSQLINFLPQNDGATMNKFFNTWAKIARGDDDDGIEKIASTLDFTSSSRLFPPQTHLPQEFVEMKKEIFFYEGKSLVRRFVFNAKAIEDIKMKVSSESVPHPTRVEALTTFIWKHMILATRRAKGHSSRPFMVSHLVNLRSRIDPKLPNAFGNLVFVANSEVLQMSDDEVELPHLLGIVREMFENMNSENLKALEGDDAFDCIVDMITQVGSLMSQLDTYKFSSWCNFRLYDVDFGWGKPNFVAPFIDTISSLNKQQIILVENGKNDGIEAWILRSNDEMVELENDEEFLAFSIYFQPISYIRNVRQTFCF
ncbi:putative serine/threonine protein phosphatase 2A 57 kDa regulatory subunit B' beta isoform-like [Capsicum annuum]|nr:putative serine/threonine protein phosphatase 2A 57 kDa regulatory subunit B' beta isoform-like [Capsicum annuum]